MTIEQAAPYAVVSFLLLEKIYNIFTAGQKDFDRTKKQISDAMDAKEHTAAREAELKEQISDEKFDRMASDISRISDSIAEILRMIRESVATKQDILQEKARIDALEASNRDHYESFKKVRDEISQMRISCARYHRTPSDSSAFPRERA